MPIPFRTTFAAGAAVAAAQQDGKSEHEQMLQGELVAHLVDHIDHKPPMVVKTPQAQPPAPSEPRPARRLSAPLAAFVRWVRRE